MKFIPSRIQFIKESDKRQAHYFLSLRRLDPLLDSQSLTLDSRKFQVLRIESRKETVKLLLNSTV